MGQEKIQLYFMDTDSFVLRMNTKDIVKVSNNLEDRSDFSNLDENHEIFSIRNKKTIGKIKIETPKNIWIDESLCLGSKAYSFVCIGENTNEIKKIVNLNQKIMNLKIIINV